jgi:hypothetical protein
LSAVLITDRITLVIVVEGRIAILRGVTAEDRIAAASEAAVSEATGEGTHTQVLRTKAQVLVDDSHPQWSVTDQREAKD